MAVNDRQQSYLDAMGIQVWYARETADDAVTEPANDSLPHDEAVVSLQKNSSQAAQRITSSEGLAASSVRHDDWSQLEKRVAACLACDLSNGRSQTVFAVGDKQADWMVIGEAPGAEEDCLGEPFVGQSGQLLNKMLLAIGLKREQVFMANMLKCRLPSNRTVRPEEVEQCGAYLQRQIELLQPKIILVVGSAAAQWLLKSKDTLAAMRGKCFSYSLSDDCKIPVAVTYHPAYLLRNPAEKRKAWQDLQFSKKLYAQSIHDEAAEK